jgi:hypothetical protein
MSKLTQPFAREDGEALSGTGVNGSGAQPAQLFTRIDELELREAQLEAAIRAGDRSPVVLAELARVCREQSWCYETLEDLGVFDAPGGPESDQAARTS